MQHDDGTGELDLSETLDAFTERTDQQPESYRWSYSREIEGSRLMMVASRSAHVDSRPLRWKRVRGPWFDNNLASAEVTDGVLSLWWATGEVGTTTTHRRCGGCVSRDAPRH